MAQLVLLLAMAGGWMAARAQTPSANPFTSDADVAKGAGLYQTHCSYCHGARGEGGRGPDLTTGRYRHGSTDAEIYNNIRNGIRGTEMPQVRASDDDVWRMVAFVRRIGASAVTEEAVPGDPAAGKAIFEGKGKCTGCHAVGPGGAAVGPDLSEVGRRRGAAFLRDALVKPEAEIPILYRGVRVVTKTGLAIAGTRLNEDDISIQIRDLGNTPRSFLKSGLREIQRDKPSLMPAYGTSLSAKELDDVVAYLSSLREAQ